MKKQLAVLSLMLVSSAILIGTATANSATRSGSPTRSKQVSDDCTGLACAEPGDSDGASVIGFRARPDLDPSALGTEGPDR